MVAVVVLPLPVSTPVFWPMMVTWGPPESVHATVPVTEPRMMTRRLPVGMDEGKVGVLVTTTVSASEAHRLSWCFMHPPWPIPVHSPSAVQGRQLLLPVSQMGVLPAQWLLLVHVTQVPAAVPAVAHALVAESLAAHSSFDLHAPQRLLEQMGFATEQLVLVRHSTHLLVPVSQ